jgi:ATP-binding protein involved in chromosome partitioning
METRTDHAQTESGTRRPCLGGLETEGKLISKGIAKMENVTVDKGAEKTQAMDDDPLHIKENLKRVKHRIVVFSGKGGVGKTTVAVNLAFALSKRGFRVGLLDADVTGPDVPKMIGLQDKPRPAGENRVLPPTRHCVKVISFASMIEQATPVIWRGPLRSRALQQFLGDVVWGKLDYLIADLPPGTGDEVLTMAQSMEPQMAVVVTTPQEMSLVDSRRAINMAKTMEIPRIGVVENMSGLKCPECGHSLALFGSGGGERVARELQVELLGQVPISLKARADADEGKPIVLEDEEADVSRALVRVAEKLVESVAESGD